MPSSGPPSRGDGVSSKEEQSAPALTHTGGTSISWRSVVGRLTTPRYSYEPATSSPTRAHATSAGRADGTWAPARYAALCASDGTTDGALGWATHN